MPENNFGLIRHCAALAVLVSHSVALTTGQEATELGMRLTRNQMTLGHLAVFTFFILSGYLITQSWQRRPQLGSFLIARAGRLLPGLALSLVGCVVAGAVVTTLPVVDYAADPATGQFVWLNLSLLGFAGPLPGVFAGHPVPAVNGSLWTLQYEATCYAILAGLGLAGLLRGWVVLAMHGGRAGSGQAVARRRASGVRDLLPGRHGHGGMAAAGPGLGAVAVRGRADHCCGDGWIAAGLRHGWRVPHDRGGYGPAVTDRD